MAVVPVALVVRGVPRVRGVWVLAPGAGALRAEGVELAVALARAGVYALPSPQTGLCRLSSAGGGAVER
ncbi:hypothetical protein CKO15_11800 [Halorhodospira abdelmalekii]|nr:hypothetical protein [Halorhodospira abdelmalekii]